MKLAKKISLYLGVIGLLLIISGVSYAIFEANYKGFRKQEVVVGENFLFSFNESSSSFSLTDKNILTDSEGKISDEYFDFELKLQTKSIRAVDYNIYLTTDETNNLNEGCINLYLTDQNDNSILKVTSISGLKKHETYDNSRYLYSGTIISRDNIETVKKYRLRAWVSSSYYNPTYQTNVTEDGLHTSTTTKKTYKFTVNVEAKEGKIINILSSSWKDKTENEKSYLALYTIDTKDLPETYSYNEEVYTLTTTIDVSGQENGNVILGEYTSGSNMIAVMGQDKGVVAPENSVNLFGSLSKVTIMDLSKLDTSNVTNMNGMFSSCRSLTSLDLSNFNTENVTRMGGMFMYNSKLTSLDLKSFDTSKVTDMSMMFIFCSNLVTLDLTNFNTSNVTTMQSMFYSCENLTSLDLKSFDTTNVTNMNMLFSECSSLAELDLSSFNTSNVTNMSSMFERCEKLTTLDLTSFDTNKVTKMNDMFFRCSSLTSITVGCNFVIGESTTTTDMFYNAGTNEVTKVCNES